MTCAVPDWGAIFTRSPREQGSLAEGKGWVGAGFWSGSVSPLLPGSPGLGTCTPRALLSISSVVLAGDITSMCLSFPICDIG